MVFSGAGLSSNVVLSSLWRWDAVSFMASIVRILACFVVLPVVPSTGTMRVWDFECLQFDYFVSRPVVGFIVGSGCIVSRGPYLSFSLTCCAFNLGVYRLPQIDHRYRTVLIHASWVSLCWW